MAIPSAGPPRRLRDAVGVDHLGHSCPPPTCCRAAPAGAARVVTVTSTRALLGPDVDPRNRTLTAGTAPRAHAQAKAADYHFASACSSSSRGPASGRRASSCIRGCPTPTCRPTPSARAAGWVAALSEVLARGRHVAGDRRPHAAAGRHRLRGRRRPAYAPRYVSTGPASAAGAAPWHLQKRIGRAVAALRARDRRRPRRRRGRPDPSFARTSTAVSTPTGAPSCPVLPAARSAAEAAARLGSVARIAVSESAWSRPGAVSAGLHRDLHPARRGPSPQRGRVQVGGCSPPVRRQGCRTPP